MASAYRYGGFVGAWVNTARKTFKHVYIFGTRRRARESDSRETFVVVVSNEELDLKDLGKRADDPKFLQGRKADPAKTVRSRGGKSHRPEVAQDHPDGRLCRRLRTCWRRWRRLEGMTDRESFRSRGNRGIAVRRCRVFGVLARRT